MIDLFAYGTLAFPEIMKALTDRIFDSSPATPEGYARYEVREANYPGIIMEDSP